MTDRYAPFRDIAKDLNVDAVALVPGANFTRLFGKAFASQERPLVVVVPQNGPPAAVVPNLELTSFALLGFEGEAFDWRDQSGYHDAFAAMAAHLPLKSIAVEGQVMRVFVDQALRRAYRDIKIIDAEPEISALRMEKTPAEIASLEEAIRISEAALQTVIDSVKVGQSEKDIERKLIATLFEKGGEGLSFPPIVAAADNAARPHAKAREDYAIKAGDALLFDFGAIKGGICADITRTFFVGHATDKAAEIYETVRKANIRGLEALKPGATAHEVDDAATRVLEDSAYAEFIRHKTGHGLGREVHEAPYIMRGNDQIMRPGMVVTIEPGLYVDGELGVRIEDDVLVTEGGCRSLTTFAKDLTIIG